MEPGNIAEWVGIAAAILIGGTAFVRAGKANSIAAGDALTSKDALRQAGIANQTSKSANEIAKTAVVEAGKAAEEARRSADIAERAENRQTERNDVNWVIPRKYVGGTWKVTNRGIDTAFEAYVVLEVGEHRIVSESTDVAGGESIEIDLSEIYKAKVAKNRAATANARASGVAYFASSALAPGYHIHWRTENGIWHTKRSDG